MALKKCDTVCISFEYNKSSEPISRDGRILLLLVGIILFGPYLPRFGPIEGRVRLDQFLLPGVAILFFLRATVERRVLITSSVGLYSAFIFWLLAITAVTMIDPPSKYGVPSVTVLLAGIDSYVRPLLILFIVANARVCKRDLMALVKCVLIAGIPLSLLGALQLVPATASAVNNFVFMLYDFGRNDRLYWDILVGGRAMSVFGQVGTFAMFNLMCLGLLGAHFLGVRIVSSRSLLWLMIVSSIIGGVVSGSKVFTGGVIILAILFILYTPLVHRLIKLRNLIVFAVMIFLVFVVLSRVLAPSLTMLEARFKITSFSSLYDMYLAPRLGDLSDPLSGKLVRSGAGEIIQSHPLFGLGFTVVGRTTDSFLLGLLIMGGMVGGLIYLSFLGIVFRRLYLIARWHPDQMVATLSRVMFFLTIVFLLAAIGFHTFIQDRAGDIYWIILGMLISHAMKWRQPSGEG